MKLNLNLDETRKKRLFIVGGIFLGIIALNGIRGLMPDKPVNDLDSYSAWSKGAAKEFLKIPVQHEGRVKPMTSLAYFELLGLRSKTNVKFTVDGEKEKVTHSQWILDTLFRPSVAKELPNFVVDDSDAVVMIGAAEKMKRDYYSYEELFPNQGNREKLFKLAREFNEKQQQLQANESGSLESVESQVVLLANRVNTFEFLASVMLPANPGAILNATLLDQETIDLARKTTTSEMLEVIPEMSWENLQQMAMPSRAPGTEEDNQVRTLMRLAFLYGVFSRGMAIFPPTFADDNVITTYFADPDDFRENYELFGTLAKVDVLAKDSEWADQVKHLFIHRNDLAKTIHKLELSLGESMRKPDAKLPRYLRKVGIEDTASLSATVKQFNELMHVTQDSNVAEWKSPGDLVKLAVENKEFRPWAIERIKRLETLVAASKANDASEFESEIANFREFIEKEADSRGEMRSVGMEISYREAGYEMMAKVFLVLSFTVMGFIWISPYSQFGKISLRTTEVLGAIGAGLMILMIILRMLIQNRPPITNLFDTFLFIGGLGFFLGLAIENITRKRIAISAGVMLAMVCVLLLGPFREINTSETMSPLEAVLDTNFWLWIHVTTINVGYCSGLLAALAAHFYIIGQAFNVDTGNRDQYRSLTRIVYGIACFSLFFSLVGTVLGGIWANYSWGRFWGWDPKENGALMIVLWTLVILHARLGGYIRDLGINVCSIILGMIITFSWFGTNALGVGLHSYGFAQGIVNALVTFWAIELVILGLAGWVKVRDRFDFGKPKAST
tara:strand:+ start:5474 stop:7837 length:2364 start_codon:yes stop_codon:yes gene_type:complete